MYLPLVYALELAVPKEQGPQGTLLGHSSLLSGRSLVGTEGTGGAQCNLPHADPPPPTKTITTSMDLWPLDPKIFAPHFPACCLTLGSDFR